MVSESSATYERKVALLKEQLKKEVKSEASRKRVCDLADLAYKKARKLNHTGVRKDEQDNEASHPPTAPGQSAEPIEKISDDTATPQEPDDTTLEQTATTPAEIVNIFQPLGNTPSSPDGPLKPAQNFKAARAEGKRKVPSDATASQAPPPQSVPQSTSDVATASGGTGPQSHDTLASEDQSEIPSSDVTTMQSKTAANCAPPVPGKTNMKVTQKGKGSIHATGSNTIQNDGEPSKQVAGTTRTAQDQLGAAYDDGLRLKQELAKAAANYLRAHPDMPQEVEKEMAKKSMKRK